MTLTIDLRDDEVTLLAAKAQAQGVSAEHYARRVLEQDLRADEPSESISEQTIAEAIREIWADIPAEVRAKLPRDGASQVDHYVYGLPKRES